MKNPADTIAKDQATRTYAFRVLLEQDKWPDEPDEKTVWRAYIPILEHQGAASWGYTQKEALENLQNAVELLIGYMQENGKSIPSEPHSDVQVSDVPLIAVTI